MGVDIEARRKELLIRHSLSEAEFQKTGLKWDELEQMAACHLAETSDLRDTAGYIHSRLLTVPDIHSLKVRIKNPEHLIAKVIRKKLQKTDLDVTPDNYRDHITDLAGIRALHLFKDQWQRIHEFVTCCFDLAETPIAYIRDGDPVALIDALREAGCATTEHPFGYRSIHYLIKSQPAKVTRITELQVRTVFEEGWSEIDHQVRYPRLNDSPLLAEMTTVFNRLAGSADEMGSFIKGLSVYLVQEARLRAEAEQQLNEKEEKLNTTIKALNLSEKDKKELQKQIDELRRQSVRSKPGTLGYLSTSGGVISALERAALLSITVQTCSRCGLRFNSPVRLAAGSPALCFGCQLSEFEVGEHKRP